MAVFGEGYKGEMKEYFASPEGYLGSFGDNPRAPNIEAPIIGIKDLGQSVTEGARFGSLLQTSTEAIRRGAGSMELATIAGGQEPGGAESYGNEARQALRELARANNVYFTSVHSPVQVGNVSGFNPQERGFNDEFRHRSVEEVKRAIEFAADVGAGAVVVHTGEAQRDMSQAPWNREIAPGMMEMMSFEEEPGRQVLYMVDRRNGKLITEVRKSQIVFEPEYERVEITNGDWRYVDAEGNVLDENNVDHLLLRVPKWDNERAKFKTFRRDWDWFKYKAERWDKLYPRQDKRQWTAEEMFFRTQMETRILQSRGHSLFYAGRYEKQVKQRDRLLKALEYYGDLEKNVPEEELWKIMKEDNVFYGSMGQIIHGEKKKPTELIKDELRETNLSLRQIHEASSAADAQADEYEETLTHVMPVVDYAKDKTSRSYAEAGILAMDVTQHNKNVQQDVFVAPENLWPEMGYGTHPQELIELVSGARERMVQMLTEQMIPDPHERRDDKGLLLMVPNPNYQKMEKNKAQEYAKRHIKATFDTQHLGMWWKHFQPLPGETRDKRRGRFKSWFKSQVKDMLKKDILGHVHAVDALGGGHHHLPVGQGDLPVKWALEYLKKKGFKGTMVSEGHEEEARFGAGRQLTASWRHLGTNITGSHAGGGGSAPGGGNWNDMQYSYFRNMQSPYFIFGAYSPSNDWQLWSQVPME